MCSYIVEKAKLLGSAKGPNGWMRIDTANVYYDHPFHSPLDHVLGIDFINETQGGRERVAVELSADSARASQNSSAVSALRSPSCRQAHWRTVSSSCARGMPRRSAASPTTTAARSDVDWAMSTTVRGIVVTCTPSTHMTCDAGSGSRRTRPRPPRQAPCSRVAIGKGGRVNTGKLCIRAADSCSPRPSRPARANVPGSVSKIQVE